MNGKTALVTGANRGIGMAIAKQLAEHDVKVLAGMRNLAEAPPEFQNLGIVPVKLDVTCSDDLAQFETQQARSIDILVNNAGIFFDGPLLENPDTCLEVNLRAPYQLTRICTPSMIERNYGRIVNISSDMGAFSQGLTGPGPYGISKVALNALTLRLSRDLPENVKVNAMSPGWVKTRMGGSDAPFTPEEAADTAVWLATLPDDGPTGGFFRKRKAIEW